MAISKKEAKLISDSIRSLLVSQDMVDSGKFDTVLWMNYSDEVADKLIQMGIEVSKYNVSKQLEGV